VVSLHVLNKQFRNNSFFEFLETATPETPSFVDPEGKLSRYSAWSDWFGKASEASKTEVDEANRVLLQFVSRSISASRASSDAHSKKLAALVDKWSLHYPPDRRDKVPRKIATSRTCLLELGYLLHVLVDRLSNAFVPMSKIYESPVLRFCVCDGLTSWREYSDEAKRPIDSTISKTPLFSLLPPAFENKEEEEEEEEDSKCVRLRQTLCQNSLKPRRLNTRWTNVWRSRRNPKSAYKNARKILGRATRNCESGFKNWKTSFRELKTRFET
jgi:hypothetical protein